MYALCDNYAEHSCDNVTTPPPFASYSNLPKLNLPLRLHIPSQFPHSYLRLHLPRVEYSFPLAYSYLRLPTTRMLAHNDVIIAQAQPQVVGTQ